MVKYEIIIYRIKEDGAFIAEFPELAGYLLNGATYSEALANAEIIIQEWSETAKDLGNKFHYSPKSYFIMGIRTIEKVVTKHIQSKRASDFAFWQTKSYSERLQALEEIRREYNNWKYTDAEQRFQRVYRIVKLKQG